MEILAELLAYQAGGLLNYAALAKKVRASEDSIRRWISILKSLYYCFTISPWSHNISRSLIKNPKIYLVDWSQVGDPGKRAENFVACHLLKAVSWWRDLGLGEYDLHFLRTKDGREIDFLVTRNGAPWFLAEVKSSETRSLNKNLRYFQANTGAEHAFQIAMDEPYSEQNCFTFTYPVQVSARTLLSQLP